MYSLVKRAVRSLLIMGVVLSSWQCSNGSDTASASDDKQKQQRADTTEVEKNAVETKILPVDYKKDGYNIGALATTQQIAGWDIDIRPDGVGLPNGAGTAEQGEPLYEAKCAACHGAFGEGEGRWPKLAGGEGTLTHQGEDGRPEKTVGSYWPYASTLFDYIRRAMPYPAPMSLSPDESYAISAYVLYLNDLIEYDLVLDKTSLPTVVMPNQDNFYIDDRPDSSNQACMEHCKDPGSIQVASSIQGVTPVSHFIEGADSPAASHDARDLEGSSVVALGSSVVADNVAAKGAELYQSNCSVCHQKNGEGLPPAFPTLHNNAVVGVAGQLIGVLLQGRPGTAMQSFNRLSDEDLASVSSYIRKNWNNNATAITAEMFAVSR